eukprot:gene1628-1773_t
MNPKKKKSAILRKSYPNDQHFNNYQTLKLAITSIKGLADKVDEHGLAREEDFDFILSNTAAIDHSSPKTGKPLRNIAANSQRCNLLDRCTES